MRKKAVLIILLVSFAAVGWLISLVYKDRLPMEDGKCRLKFRAVKKNLDNESMIGLACQQVLPVSEKPAGRNFSIACAGLASP